MHRPHWHIAQVHYQTGGALPPCPPLPASTRRQSEVIRLFEESEMPTMKQSTNVIHNTKKIDNRKQRNDNGQGRMANFADECQVVMNMVHSDGFVQRIELSGGHVPSVIAYSDRQMSSRSVLESVIVSYFQPGRPMFARCLHRCVNGWGRRCAACCQCGSIMPGGRSAGVADALITDTGPRTTRYTVTSQYISWWTNLNFKLKTR